MLMIKEWDELSAKREIAPLPVYAMSYNIRARTHARWEHRPATAGGSNTTPYQ